MTDRRESNKKRAKKEDVIVTHKRAKQVRGDGQEELGV